MDILNPKKLIEAGPLIQQLQELWAGIQKAWQNKDLSQLGPLCQQAGKVLGKLKGIFPQQSKELDELSAGLQDLLKVMDADNADEVMGQVQQMVSKLGRMGS